MFQAEPPSKSESPNRPIRMLPYALIAGLSVYILLTLVGVTGLLPAVLSAMAGGWTLGRLTRRPPPSR